MYDHPGENKWMVYRKKLCRVLFKIQCEKKRQKCFFSHGFGSLVMEICVLIDHLDPDVEREKKISRQPVAGQRRGIGEKK